MVKGDVIGAFYRSALHESPPRTRGPINTGVCRFEQLLQRLASIETPVRMGPRVRGDDENNHTGSAMEYFTWLSAKLDSMGAMPSSRVSLFFRNASYDDRSAATTRNR